jgi:pilus assembly protein FimV
VALDSAAQAAPPLDFDLDLGGAPTKAAAHPEIVFDATVTAPPETPTTLDFDLNLGGDTAAEPAKGRPVPSGTVVMEAQKSEAAAPVEDTGISIDFDLGTTETTPAAPAPAAEPAAAPAAEMGLTLDFDLGGTSEVKPAEEKPPELNLSAISFDLGTTPAAAAGAPAPDAHWQEVATKLDLAKAYEEMGDKDGARELLNEVMKEGDAAQKQKAKALFDTLG